MRTDLEKACLEKVKIEMEKGNINTKIDFLSEIMINYDPNLGYAWELLEPNKVFFYFPDMSEILSKQQPNQKITVFNLEESLKSFEANFKLYAEVKIPEEFVGFDNWKNEHPPTRLALFKDYPKILGYPSLKPYRNYLLESYVRQGTILVHYFREKLSDWTVTYVQEKTLNPWKALVEKYRLEKRVCKIADLKERSEANRLAQKFVGNVPTWKFLLYSKELRKTANISTIGLEDFRMIKYFARPPEKVEREKEIIVRLAHEMIEGTEYAEVNAEFIKEIKKIYPWENKVWLPHLGLAKWRMMLFSPNSLRKKLLKKRILGHNSIKTYLSAKNVFYAKYPHLVDI